MNKNKIAILSNGNTSNHDEGIAVYAGRYLSLNYSFQPAIDIVEAKAENTDLLEFFRQHKEIIILDVIAIEDTPGSMYQFPMSTFREFGTDGDDEGVLACLDILENNGETLPNVSLFAMVPETVKPNIGLSSSLLKPFTSYIQMIIKALEEREIHCQAKNNLQSIEDFMVAFSIKN